MRVIPSAALLLLAAGCKYLDPPAKPGQIPYDSHVRHVENAPPDVSDTTSGSSYPTKSDIQQFRSDIAARQTAR